MAQRSRRAIAAPAEEIDRRPLTVLIWLAVGAAWLYFAASLLFFDRADPPSHAVWPVNSPVSNPCGIVGAWIAANVYTLLGWAVWVPVLLFGAGLIWTSTGRRVAQPALRVIGTIALTAAACGLLGLAAPVWSPWPDLAGGTAGAVGSHALAARFGGLGATLWLGALALVGAVVAFDRLAWAVPGWILRKLGVSVSFGATGLAGMFASVGQRLRNPFGRRAIAGRAHDLDEEPILDDEEVAAVRAKRKGIGQRLSELAGGFGATGKIDPESDLEDADDAEYEYEYEEDDEEGADEAAEYEYEEEEAEAAPVAKKKEPKPRVRANLEPKPEAADEAEDEDDIPGAPQVFSEDQIKEKIAALPVRFAGANRQMAKEEDLRDLQQMGEMEGYRFPTLDLLEEPEEDFNDTLEQLVREQAENLEAALREYRIKGEVVGIESGPVITLYDLKLAPGTKVAQLQSISSDLARALRAVNIRIVSNQVGRDTVGIEVPNPTKERVRLRELMGSRENFQKMKLPMFLGKDASGDPLIADLAQMPHMLIAGTTGSGKSVCMNTIIMSFLYTKKPNELKLVLVDPKMVEMSQFKDIPHLMCPVVTEMTKAAAILEWACKKMDERYELLAEAGCRDIASYNALEWEELKERFAGPGETLSDEEAMRIPKRLPYMVFVIDELADLMMTAKEVEGSIIRIAQKARAVGIHLILATQRPQANVVTGLIKSNMPCRVCFKVSSGIDSRVVMDQKGGELLLGQGDMLYLSPRTHKTIRAQGTLVDDHEIRRVVKFLRDVAGPSFERQLVQLRATSDEERIFESENHSSASLAAAQEDPMFDRAVEIIAETQRGSVSLLQRRLGIGYTRASRLIDLMGLAGFIGEHKGSVARAVLITPEQWAQVKEFAEQETGSAFPTAQGMPEPEGDGAEPEPSSAVATEDASDDEPPAIEQTAAVEALASETPEVETPEPETADVETPEAKTPASADTTGEDDDDTQMLFDGLGSDDEPPFAPTDQEPATDTPATDEAVSDEAPLEVGEIEDASDAADDVGSEDTESEDTEYEYEEEDDTEHAAKIASEIELKDPAAETADEAAEELEGEVEEASDDADAEDVEYEYEYEYEEAEDSNEAGDEAGDDKPATARPA